MPKTWSSGAGIVAAALLLGACGGGGGGADGAAPAPPPAWVAGVFAPSRSFEGICTREHENNWLRSWTRELYLWYDEVPDLNPASFDTEEFFELLKTPLSTASGRAKDRFHFALSTDEFLAQSEEGEQLGYGAAWVILSGVPPRRAVVAFVEPGSPAAAAGLARGDEVLSVDGVDFVNANSAAAVDALNRAFWPAREGERHVFGLRSAAGVSRPNVALVARRFVSDPVPVVRTLAGGTVGYLLFNDHIATAEGKLVDAVGMLAAQGVRELVLDLRYNGGGFLDIASELAFMIAGPARSAGRAFERPRFSNQHPITNPVTGEALSALPFHATTQGFSGASGRPLPSLNLSRVFVLTSADTCSASEAIINGLRGVNVDVIQIGGGTCGKPFGFYPADNCGTTYFSIQFQGYNELGFGDFADGFVPQDQIGSFGLRLPGCTQPDDFSRPLGDAAEARLAAALRYVQTGRCDDAAVAVTKSGAPVEEPRLLRSPAREAAYRR